MLGRKTPLGAISSGILAGGKASEIEDYKTLLADESLNKSQQYKAETDKVKLQKVFGSDYYPEMEKSNVQIYNELNYRQR